MIVALNQIFFYLLYIFYLLAACTKHAPFTWNSSLVEKVEEEIRGRRLIHVYLENGRYQVDVCGACLTRIRNTPVLATFPHHF